MSYPPEVLALVEQLQAVSDALAKRQDAIRAREQALAERERSPKQGKLQSVLRDEHGRIARVVTEDVTLVETEP